MDFCVCRKLCSSIPSPEPTHTEHTYISFSVESMFKQRAVCWHRISVLDPNSIPETVNQLTESVHCSWLAVAAVISHDIHELTATSNFYLHHHCKFHFVLCSVKSLTGIATVIIIKIGVDFSVSLGKVPGERLLCWQACLKPSLKPCHSVLCSSCCITVVRAFWASCISKS